jgi:ATP-dependent RNA helicase DDX47/RRP3
VIVSTPGRLLDHLSNTKGFNLNNLKFLVLDEADKLLNKDFELQFNEIVEKLPTERNAYLYSATLTHKVEKLERVSLKNPKRIEVSQKYQTVSNLEQFYVFIPSKLKDCYLLHLLHKNEDKKIIIFAQTKLGSERIALLLQEVGEKVECLHGDMSQVQRIIGL